MIRSFRDKATERVWLREREPTLSPDIQRAAQKKLRLINAASQLNSLRIPPGNRLEKLSGDRTGQYSIRVNSQYRICFRWEASGAEDVEITDYH
ncbi:type II toxin-antitoxin system RelE/ParE family toxin [Microbacterium sp. GXF6406]